MLSKNYYNFEMNPVITATANNQAMNTLVTHLQQINNAYVRVFTDDGFHSPILSKKHAAFLYTQVCGFLDQGSTELRNDKKQQLMHRFRGWVQGFIREYVLAALHLRHDSEDFIGCLIERWDNFKKFCYLYLFLLRAADNYYEQSYKAYKNLGKPNKIDSSDSIFPVPVIATHYFQTLVYDHYKPHISKQICSMLAQQREGKPIDREALRSLFQIVYSCGLRQLARINSVKTNNNQSTFQFYASNSKDIEKCYTSFDKNPDAFFFANILDSVIADSQAYYRRLFEEKICHFGPQEDFANVLAILDKEEEISEYYFFNHRQKDAYLNKIKEIIVLMDLEHRLTRVNSLKWCLEKFNHTSDEYLGEIKIYIDCIFKAKKQALKVLENVVRSFLMESGAKLNEKISKRKEYMNEVVNLKKSFNRIVDELMHKDLDICIVRDSCFKKILDSIEASRSLAQFTDLRIKQCIKNKVGQSDWQQKIKDVFIILQNLVAIDSFLIYHQQLLGRRLLEPINEPRTDIEKYIIRKIGQRLGTVTVAAHAAMLKDIEKSQQISENYSRKLPFARFKWSCRIIIPTFWPDNINNNTLQLQLPETLRIQAETIQSMYNQQFSRFISWKCERGSSLFEGTFTTGKYRFQSENVFMLLLLSISEGSNHQLRFWQLLQKTNKLKQGSVSYLIRCVRVLIENGLVGRSNPNPHEPIQEGELLTINKNYKPGPNYKPNQPVMIKASLQIQKAMYESTVEQNKILKEREKVVEAVLVKLLKHSHSTGANKMTFEQLLKGVRQYEHLKNYDISQSVVKQRIEEIIARGYCERNADDRRVFHYIA